MKIYRLILLVLLSLLGGLVVACSSQANVASHNLSKAADQFQVMRRVVFFNGITDTYLLTIEGLCSLGNSDPAGELSVTCKTGPESYKKHFLGLSDNVSYFVEQLEPLRADVYHYKVLFRPETLLPDIDRDTSGSPDKP